MIKFSFQLLKNPFLTTLKIINCNLTCRIIQKINIMKKNLFFFGFLIFMVSHAFSQEKIAVIQDPFVLLLNAETGEIEDPAFIDLTPLNPGTPKGIRQIGDEIWITDQIEDLIYRFDLAGNHLSNITGAMDNIKGLDIIDGSEVWVTNAGSNNGAPGDAIVRIDLEGNILGNFPTPTGSTFDVLDNGSGEVYISYIAGGSPIERRDYDGNSLGNLVDPNHLNFAQQMWITEDGNLLVASFSSNTIYLFDIASGAEIQNWTASSARGVIETGDGHILWTSSAGISRMDPDTGTSTILSSGSAQFFTLLFAEENSDCTDPTLSVETPDPICANTTATITATSDGDEVNWYDAADATEPIFTGLVFETPELTESTSYWVQAFNEGTGDGEVIEGGARLAPSSNSQSAVVEATSPWGLSFDTTEDFTITGVDVYLTDTNPGNVIVQLLDVNWDLIEETTIAVPAGNSTNPIQHELSLNFSVEAGNTYRLVAAFPSVEMVREFSSEHAGFPYPIGDVGTVTGGTINNSNTNNTVYYFFYNWTVETGESSSCESERLQVDVTVNPAPEAPIAIGDFDFVDGDTLADLEDSLDFEGDLTWYADEELTEVLPNTTLLEDNTTYWVTQTIDGCESEALAVLVEELGVNDLNGNMFSVYPNPVNTILNINGLKNIDLVEIFDMTGRKLSSQMEIQNNQIDFSHFEKGTYLVRISTGKENQVIKVIKN